MLARLVPWILFSGYLRSNTERAAPTRPLSHQEAATGTTRTPARRRAVPLAADRWLTAAAHRAAYAVTCESTGHRARDAIARRAPRRARDAASCAPFSPSRPRTDCSFFPPVRADVLIRYLYAPSSRFARLSSARREGGQAWTRGPSRRVRVRARRCRVRDRDVALRWGERAPAPPGPALPPSPLPFPSTSTDRPPPARVMCMCPRIRIHARARLLVLAWVGASASGRPAQSE